MLGVGTPGWNMLSLLRQMSCCPVTAEAANACPMQCSMLCNPRLHLLNLLLQLRMEERHVVSVVNRRHIQRKSLHILHSSLTD